MNGNISEILIRLSALLRTADEPDWAGVCDRLAAGYAANPYASNREILAMYGGMGSFNDIVLHNDGIPLVAENDELDSLRSLLHTSCLRELS